MKFARYESCKDKAFFVRGGREGARRASFLSAEGAEGRGEHLFWERLLQGGF